MFLIFGHVHDFFFYNNGDSEKKYRIERRKIGSKKMVTVCKKGNQKFVERVEYSVIEFLNCKCVYQITKKKLILFKKEV